MDMLLFTHMYKGAEGYNDLFDHSAFRMFTGFMYASMEYAFPVLSQKHAVNSWSS